MPYGLQRLQQAESLDFLILHAATTTITKAKS